MEEIIKAPYYSFKYTSDESFDMLTTQPIESFKQSLMYSFSGAFEDINSKKYFYYQAKKIRDITEFNNLIRNTRWSERFVKHYCFSAFYQYLYFSYFYSRANKNDREAEIEFEKYGIILSNLRTELESMGYSAEIIHFHMEYIKRCARHGEEFSHESISEVLDLLVNNKKYRNDESGILRFEAFVSANTFG